MGNGLTICANVDDLEWPWTVETYAMTGNVQNEAKFVLKFLEVFFENLQKVPEGYPSQFS